MKDNSLERILVSWISFNNDFLTNVAGDKIVNIEGPTITFYRRYFIERGYSKHYIFVLKKDQTLAEKLQFEIGRHIQNEDIVKIIIIEETDAIDIEKLNIEVSAKLKQIRGGGESRQRNIQKRKQKNIEINALFSTGTPAMQITWVLCKFAKLVDKIFQTRRAEYIVGEKAGLVEIDFVSSNIPYISDFKQEKSSDFLIDEITALKSVYQKASLAAKFNYTILIHGESGTGKENLAQYIHKTSGRNRKPFLAINCASFGESLLESRLFGHVSGAFTGANKDVAGYFETTEGGTLFLDEIGDISLNMQQALLRVLQEGEYSPVGSTEVKKTNVRIIAASNKNLIELCEKNVFRWDLYYRLAVVELELPTFREFTQRDKSKFINFFIRNIGETLQDTIHVESIVLSEEVMDILIRYPFPGNIRELKHLIEGLYTHQVEVLEKEHLPKRVLNYLHAKQKSDEELIWDLKELEKAHIQKALIYFGTQAKAAAAVGYKNATHFGKLLKKYNLK